MNQIVIAIKKENILTYLTLFDNRTESFTAFNEMRLRDKELWAPGYTVKTDTIPKKTHFRTIKLLFLVFKLAEKGRICARVSSAV